MNQMRVNVRVNGSFFSVDVYTLTMEWTRHYKTLEEAQAYAARTRKQLGI